MAANKKINRNRTKVSSEELADRLQFDPVLKTFRQRKSFLKTKLFLSFVVGILLGAGGVYWMLNSDQQKLSEKILAENKGASQANAVSADSAGKKIQKAQPAVTSGRLQTIAVDDPPIVLPIKKKENVPFSGTSGKHELSEKNIAANNSSQKEINKTEEEMVSATEEQKNQRLPEKINVVRDGTKKEELLTENRIVAKEEIPSTKIQSELSMNGEIRDGASSSFSRIQESDSVAVGKAAKDSSIAAVKKTDSVVNYDGSANALVDVKKNKFLLALKKMVGKDTSLNRWSIGLAYMPAYYSVGQIEFSVSGEKTTISPSSTTKFSHFYSKSFYGISQNAGVNLGYKIFKNWQIRTGFLYTLNKDEQRGGDVFTMDSLTYTFGYIYSNQSLYIPFILTYNKAGRKKISPFYSIGVSLREFLGEKISGSGYGLVNSNFNTSYSFGSGIKDLKIERWDLILSAGINYRISKPLQVSLAPSYQYGLNADCFSLGIKFGIDYTFCKEKRIKSSLSKFY